MGCKHRHLTYKIYKLFSTDEFEERLLFIRRCKKCNRLTIRLFYTRWEDENGDCTKWVKTFVHTQAELKLALLKPEIIGIYKAPSLKFLDIGWVYLDGRAGAMKKLHNGAVISREINGPSTHITDGDLIDKIDEHNYYLTQINI